MQEAGHDDNSAEKSTVYCLQSSTRQPARWESSRDFPALVSHWEMCMSESILSHTQALFSSVFVVYKFTLCCCVCQFLFTCYILRIMRKKRRGTSPCVNVLNYSLHEITFLDSDIMLNNNTAWSWFTLSICQNQCPMLIHRAHPLTDPPTSNLQADSFPHFHWKEDSISVFMTIFEEWRFLNLCFYPSVQDFKLLNLAPTIKSAPTCSR